MADSPGAIDSISIDIGASSEKAIKSIQNLSAALKDLKEVANVNISKSLKESVAGLSAALKGLTSDDIKRLRQLSTALSRLAGVGRISISSTLATNISNLSKAIEEMPTDTERRLRAVSTSVKGMKGVSLNKNIPDSLRAIGIAVWDISDKALGRLDKVTESLSKLKGLDLQGVSKAMKWASDSVKVEELKKKLAEAKEAKKSLTDIVKGESGEGSKSTGSALPQLGKSGSSAASGMARLREILKSTNPQIQKAGTAAKKSSGGLMQFAAALKRIAMYRLLRTIIKEITQAFQEGLQNVYAFSQTIGSSISQALDSISGASLRMKNQLGAALGELLVTIRPVLEAIISLITRVADAISQFFAVLGGRMVYHKATDSVKQWGAAATGAAKAAKEWKNQLMGFDEINRLEEPSDTGGGGGGGDSGIGNWELSPVTLDLSWLDKYREATKEWLDNLDWEPITKAWDTLEQRLKEFAKIVDSVVYWAYTNVLLPLGKWVIEDAAPASVELLASMFNVLNAVLERVAPIFQWLWKEILRPFGTWLGKEFSFIITRLAEIFNELADVIRGKMKFKDFWDELSGAEKVLLAVSAAVAGLSVVMYALSHPITTVISVLILLGSALGITTEDILKCFEWIKNAVGSLLNTFDFLVEGVKTVFAGIKTYFSGLVDFIAGAITGDWARAWDGIVQIVYGVYQTFVGIIQSMFGWVNSLIDGLAAAISWIRGLFDHISALASSGGLSLFGGHLTIGTPYASGGFPEDGLFFANHNEMVGQFSNGRTAVANNEQITEGIANAVYGAFMSAFSQTGGSGGNQPVNIYLDGKIIANSTTKYQNQYARVRGV